MQRRQLWSSTPKSSHDLTSAAITTFLAELDGCDGDSAQQRGPFSVFSASNPSSTIKPADAYESNIELAVKTTESGCDSGQVQDNQFSTSSNAAQHISKNKKTPPLLGVNSYTVLYDAFSSQSLHHPGLSRPETELIHHWVVFLSSNMLLLDTPDNPCRTIFMPLALKGLDSPSNDPNIHRSIFHAICSSSAFSLFHLRGEQRYQSIAMHHDQLALRHLRENLQRAKRLDEPTLAAILACITAEAMSGRRTRWRTHVAGGLGLLENEIQEDWIRGPTASRLLQSYLSLSSLCSLPMSSQHMSLLNGPPELHHYMERSHGVTTPLVQLLAHINSLIESKADLPSSELDRLEMRIYLSFPCLSVPGAPGSNIIQHAANSFYYATIIYFRRSLRLVPLCDVQDLVQKAIQELEAVDVLTRDETGGCAYNWAGFVVAAECQQPDLQTRMLSLFENKSRHGIQSINVLCEIVQALWHRRVQAGAGTDIHWQELAREADFDIILV